MPDPRKPRNDPRVEASLFSNGSDFDYWVAANCEAGCRFYRESREPGFAECPILDAIYEATTGSFPLPFARLFNRSQEPVDEGEGFEELSEQAHTSSFETCPGFQAPRETSTPQGALPDTSALAPYPVDEWSRGRA